MTTDVVAHVAEAIRRASRVTVLTGAGVSAASGIPTFRGAGGLWKKVRAETLASTDAFENDPKLVWEWYDWRRGMIRDAQPNRAHTVLAKWTRERPGTTVITQNVDGLHERSGTDPITRLHGSIWHVRCWSGCQAGRRDWIDDTVPLPTLPPRCPHCGGLVRPGVVWFGESLDPAVLSVPQTLPLAAMYFLPSARPRSSIPRRDSSHTRGDRAPRSSEINPEATGASGIADLVIRQPADEALGAIDTQLARGV